MATVTSFIRNTPMASLKVYFDEAGVTLIPPVNWDAPKPEIVRPLLQAIDEMDAVARDTVETLAERVAGMVDEAGEAAIYSIAQDTALLDTLRNAYDRALWMYINDAAGFRRAEEVRFTDERRRGRMWDGFIGEPNLVLKRDPGSIDTFKAAMR